MNPDPSSRPKPEDYGLRLEEPERLRLLDILLIVGLVISGLAWVWLSLVGVETRLLAVLGSPVGRILAALIGLASVAAVLRAFIVSRWPLADSDRSLV
jgi:hypothetical protein